MIPIETEKLPVEKLPVEKLLRIVIGLQIAIFVALIVIWTQASKAAQWSQVASVGAIAVKSSVEDTESSVEEIKDHFDSSGAIKCQSE